MSRSSRTPVVIAVLAGAALAGFGSHYLLGRREAQGPVPTAGTASPSAPAEEARETKKAIPETVPDVTLADREGKPRSLAEWRGRPLLINFWATWCAPCRREIPLLMDLRRERRASDLEVIGIAVDFREEVLAYAKEIGIDYPLLIGEEDGLAAVDAFGMEMLFPFTVFADREGQIVALKVGELHRDEADFILDRMQEVEAGSLDLAAAREQIASRLRDLAAERARAQPSA